MRYGHVEHPSPGSQLVDLLNSLRHVGLFNLFVLTLLVTRLVLRFDVALLLAPIAGNVVPSSPLTKQGKRTIRYSLNLSSFSVCRLASHLILGELVTE